MAQRQRLLTCTGFAEFVFKLTNLFLHTRQSIIHQRHFVFQRGHHVGQLLLLNQRSASQIFFIFTQRQFRFFLPLVKLGSCLLDTTR